MPASHLPDLRRAAGERITSLGWAARLGLSFAYWVMWVVAMLVAGVAMHSSELRPRPWMILVDAVVGLALAGLALGRRRWPLAVTLAASLLSAFTSSGFGFLTWIFVSFGSRRRWRQVPLVIVAHWASVTLSIFFPMFPQPGVTRDIQLLNYGLAFMFSTLWAIVCLAIGFYVGARRELIITLTDRAETAEREQALRIAQGQAAERARIAREMHDILAHRISMVAMHAGVLAYRDDLSREQTKDIARTIEENSRASLTELRVVLGTLRDGEAQPSTPQPTLLDLEQLIDESRAAGLAVTLDDRLGPLHLEVPTGTGRHAYRIIQEALTNARKHAAGSPVTVTLAGTRGEVRIEVRNPLGRESGVPGAGMGLVGIAERARLAGGTLEAGRVWGDFVVEAWLPWTT